jgi:hypothetical protein
MKIGIKINHLLINSKEISRKIVNIFKRDGT